MDKKHKKGRPEIEDSLKKNIPILLKVNKKEKEYLDSLLKNSDYYKSRNAMIRDILINRKYTVRELKEDRIKLIEVQLLKKELNGIGPNFNQTVKHINSKKLNYFSENDKKSDNTQ
jgi:hypothetical protein